MKRLLFIACISAQMLVCSGQQPEFTVYANGLIYSDTTMLQLRHIVDSLNIQFRHCDLTKKYYSAEQAIACYIDLPNSQAPEAFRDAQQDISFYDFIKKYRPSTIDSNLLLTRTRYMRRLQPIDYFIAQRPDDRYAPDIYMCPTLPGALEEDQYSIKGIKGHWLFDYTKPGNKNVETHFRAFYLPHPLAVAPIPDRYAKLILYADCMVDTSAGIFYPGAWEGDLWSLLQRDSTRPHGKVDAFNQYIAREKEDVFKKYRLPVPKVREWANRDSLLKQYVQDSLSVTASFRQLLQEAVDEALRYKTLTNDYLEYFTATYYSKTAALSMKRNRKVYGSCSMDERPREHAVSIALLAAETANWEVFLRAHLDIMNDHFERVADNNFAQAARNTYIREIEDLDINVQDLMLGISFAADGAPANHYFGNAGRLGRAFAETKYKAGLERQLLAMISDRELDDYNRLRMRCLYLNYVYYLPHREDRLACLRKLEEADKTLPACIASRIEKDNKVYEDGNAPR